MRPAAASRASRAATRPTVRPDVDWAEQTRINQEMDKLKTDPKFSISGQPGNFKLNWQDNLGPPP